MATNLKPVDPTPDPLDNMSLPGWLYHDPEFFEAEKDAFLRSTPQVVCHESEIAEPGEWRSLEYLGESLFVIRGDGRFEFKQSSRFPPILHGHDDSPMIFPPQTRPATLPTTRSAS